MKILIFFLFILFINSIDINSIYLPEKNENLDKFVKLCNNYVTEQFYNGKEVNINGKYENENEIINLEYKWQNNNNNNNEKIIFRNLFPFNDIINNYKNKTIVIIIDDDIQNIQSFRNAIIIKYFNSIQNLLLVIKSYQPDIVILLNSNISYIFDYCNSRKSLCNYKWIIEENNSYNDDYDITYLQYNNSIEFIGNYMCSTLLRALSYSNDNNYPNSINYLKYSFSKLYSTYPNVFIPLSYELKNNIKKRMLITCDKGVVNPLDENECINGPRDYTVFYDYSIFII